MKYDKVMAAAIQHAKDSYPRESCGFFYVRKGRIRYEPVVNQSAESDKFMVSPEDYLRVEALGEIIALVHSHPDGEAAPSVADQQAHSVSGLDWVIVALNGDNGDEVTHCIMPAVTDKPPLMGRVFLHGVTDCYTFVRDWYAELGIALPDFARTDNWWENGENLYLENFAKAGFEQVAEPQDGDVLLMTIGSSVPNHGAIYCGDAIEHHLYGRLSCREVYGQFYRDRTTHVLRHKDRIAND